MPIFISSVWNSFLYTILVHCLVIMIKKRDKKLWISCDSCWILSVTNERSESIYNVFDDRENDRCDDMKKNAYTRNGRAAECKIKLETRYSGIVIRKKKKKTRRENGKEKRQCHPSVFQTLLKISGLCWKLRKDKKGNDKNSLLD